MGKKVLIGSKKSKAIQMLAEEASQVEIGQVVGVSQRAISKFRARSDIKAQIEAIQSQIISEAGNLAKENTISCIEVAHGIYQRAKKSKQPGKILNNNKVALELSEKKEKRILQAMGFSSAPNQAVFLQQFFQSAGAQDASQELESVKKFLDWKREADVQDAEIVESEDAGGE